MKELIASLCLFLIIGVLYVLERKDIVKNTLGDIFKDLVDASPAIIMLFFPKFECIVFLTCCLIANQLIYDNLIVGAILFIIGYVSCSIFSISFSLVIPKFLIALVSSVSIVIMLVCIYKEDIKLRIAAVIYGLLTLPFLFYAFHITWNPGFLALVIGDVLLLVGEIFPNKTIRIISDLFYFFGTCFVPLSLFGRWFI